MSRKSELLRRAAECERLIALASDPKKKLIFKRLRDTWIVLANHSPNLSAENMAADIAAIEEIQFLFEERPIYNLGIETTRQICRSNHK